jgi:hypothetical protein
MKKFNITGTCIPELHYIVDISSKLDKVLHLVETGEYFHINRPRQYGKTTMLSFLVRELRKRPGYFVISTSFEGLGDESFKDAESFCSSFIQILSEILKHEENTILLEFIQSYETINNLKQLSIFISNFIQKSNQKVVLIIDEVDKASNFNLFINFLGMLRDKYLKKYAPTFHSVVLAGLHDIKNIKQKIRPDTETNKYNSPWNIAAEFKVDMSFNVEEIESMLVDYANHTHSVETQCIVSLRNEIHKFTSGYPFLVSKICKVIDEELDKNWSIEGIRDAINIILKEQNTLFDDLIKNIENNEDLYDLLQGILIQGVILDYNLDNPMINQAAMYGIIKEDSQNRIVMHNKIFEVRIFNYLVSKYSTKNLSLSKYNFRDNFINDDGNLEIEDVLLKFQQFLKDVYTNKDESFYERQGRLLLLAFIKPIINGNGFYYIEPQTSYERRMDIVITFNKKEYIIEVKLWYGAEYHKKGLKQLHKYLESKSVSVGYLVVFNFNKNKEYSANWIDVDEKKVFEVVV